MEQTKHHPLVYCGIIVYFLSITAILFSHNLWVSPDHFLIFAIIIAVLLGRGKKFIRDWIPFVAVYLGYEALHSINPNITHFNINITNVITAEKTIFGSVLTPKLQSLFFDEHNLHWYDFYFSFVYMSHFIAFTLFAFMLWVRQHRYFYKFAYTILLVSYASFTTFILFPVMPPWLAGERGFLPEIHRIMYLTTPYYTSPAQFHIPTLYSLFGANEYAAMPSMHAAYPVVIFLFSLLLKKKWLIFLAGIYLVSVWFGVVYLGEHYGVDVIGGLVYALIGFSIVNRQPGFLYARLLPSKPTQKESPKGRRQSPSGGSLP